MPTSDLLKGGVMESSTPVSVFVVVIGHINAMYQSALINNEQKMVWMDMAQRGRDTGNYFELHTYALEQRAPGNPFPDKILTALHN